MKTLSRIFTAMAAIAAFAACQKELPGPQPESGATKEMTLTVSNPQTKVVMNNATGSMLWGENESIAVFFGVDAVYKFDQISAGGTSSATFSGHVDDYYAEESITEVYYPYVEGWNINNYRTEGVSTTQNNRVLNTEGQYELGRIPLHWARETMGDAIVLQSDRSAIVRLAKADVTHNNGVVKVAMYNNGAKVQDYTVNVAIENSKPKDDLVFIVDVPEYDGVRQVKLPKFVLNEGATNERAAIHTGWDETLKTPKTIVPSKRYNIKPYVYFHNLNAPAKYAYVVVDNAKMSVQPGRTIYNATWNTTLDFLPLEDDTKVYDFGDYPEYDEIWYQRMKMAYSTNNSSVKLMSSTKLIDCDESQLFAYENSFNNLTWDSPVGMRGFLDGKECIVVNLGGKVGKVAIATKNVGSTSETGYGDLMTWYNAIKNYNNVNGWRLPTNDEIDCLDHVKGIHHEGYLEVSSGLSSLYFLCAGFIDYSGDSGLIGQEGFYWGAELNSVDHWGGDDKVYIKDLNLTNMNDFLFADEYTPDYSLSVRQFHSLPLTANSPEGTVGILDGKEAMVLNLNVDGVIRKVAFATKNEGANSKGDYFTGPNSILYLNCMGSYKTCAEAKALQGNGWRLPTEDEWKALMSSYPNEAGTFLCRDSEITNPNKHKAVLDVNVNGAKLRFPTGGLPGSENQMGVIGYYWTGTETPGNPSYNKSARTMYGHPFTYEDYSGSTEYKFSVRLIHDMLQ